MASVSTATAALCAVSIGADGGAAIGDGGMGMGDGGMGMGDGVKARERSGESDRARCGVRERRLEGDGERERWVEGGGERRR